MAFGGLLQAASQLREVAARRGRPEPDQDALVVLDTLTNVAGASQAAEKGALEKAAKAPQPEMKITVTADGPQVEYKGPLQDPAQEVNRAKNAPYEQYAAQLLELLQDSAGAAAQLPDPSETASLDPRGAAKELGIKKPGFRAFQRGGIVGLVQGRREYNDLLGEPEKLRAAVAAKRLQDRLAMLQPGKDALQTLGAEETRQRQDAREDRFAAREERLVQNQETSLYFDLIKRNPLGYGSPEAMVQTLQGALQRPLQPWEDAAARNEFALAEDEAKSAQLKEQLAQERDYRARLQLETQIAALQEGITARQETTKQNFAFKLADDYRKDVEPFVKVRDNVSKIEALAKRRTGEADYAIVMNFVSSIDNSVARESEVATARSTVDLANQAGLMLDKWKEGDLLNDQLRKRFVDTAKAIQESVAPRERQVKGYYRGRAKDVGIDPRAIGPGLEDDGAGAAPIVQQNPRTGAYRYSTDGGRTWQAGTPPGR